MKNLYKKIVGGALVGVMSIVGFLPQVSLAYSKNDLEIKIEGEEYVSAIAKNFGLVYMGQEYGGLNADENFKDEWEFINYLIDKNGLKQGHYYFKIGESVYHIYSPK